MIREIDRGRRREFELTLFGDQGSYPRPRLRLRDALYVATPELSYSVVPAEEPNEFGFSEIAWASLGEIKLWGALAFAIPEGQGFYHFRPLRRRTLCLASLDESRVHRLAQRLAAEAPAQSNKLHWVLPDVYEVSALYEALRVADNVLLRGVSCFLKAHLFWGSVLFMEEMGINLHISLEAGLSVLRRRLSADTTSLVSYDAVYEFLSATFTYGEALVEFWRDRRDERNMLLHPDSDLGPYAILPMIADDIYELMDPMLSLYRFILIGAKRPLRE